MKFRQKQYTIQEGHYTGPKDLEKIPGYIETAFKTSLAGAGIGAGVGGVLKGTGVMEDTGILSGASTGGKAGVVAGIAAKILLNTLHKPMKKIKFQEVDKLLRAKFGIYRVSGFTTGDTLAKRKTVEERFAFNDRRVEDYRVSFVIQDNQVTMYTLGLTAEELDKLNNSLDYYCKKFSGMDYSSRPINPRTNSYSVSLTFTNYKAISDFIYEVSEVLGVRINLLNDGVLLERLKFEEDEDDQKEFSSFIDKYDLMKMSAKSGIKALGASVAGPRAVWSSFVANMIVESLTSIKDQELAKYFPSARKNFRNDYLLSRLKSLGGIEGVYYTVGKKESPINIRLDRGLFMVTALQGTTEEKKLKDILPEDSRKEVKGKVSVWTYPIPNRGDFDITLTKIIKSGIKPNVFT